MAATITFQAHYAPPATTTHGGNSQEARRGRAVQRTAAHRTGNGRCTSPLTIQRLGRFAYALLLTCVVLAIVVALVVGVERPQPSAWTAVTVEQSGTLWALAQAHPVTGLTTAETVELIKRSNHLESALITPGQALRVPAQDSVALAVVSR
ncbi:MAG: LysM peptidoglycan-binding domain-containing protein [Coriobacteriia bacterium]